MTLTEERDGIVFTQEAAPTSAYRERWEREAAEDHVRSAIARPAEGADDYATLTGKITPFLRRFPRDLEVGTLVELGSGYGRIPLFLSRERGLRPAEYAPVDISEGMLRRLLEYRERFDVYPGARVRPVCGSIDTLPLDDDSADLVVSSAVFLHMGKSFVGRALAEAARVLKPGGDVVFDGSFPNALNLAHVPARLKPRRLRTPHALHYYRRAEVERLLVHSGLAAKAGGLEVVPTTWGLLPKNVGPLPVPLARRINAAIGERDAAEPLLAVHYGAASRGFLA
jgi:SAM-dependent methyltransferase